jgi:hypothetical protein
LGAIYGTKISVNSYLIITGMLKFSEDGAGTEGEKSISVFSRVKLDTLPLTVIGLIKRSPFDTKSPV